MDKIITGNAFEVLKELPDCYAAVAKNHNRGFIGIELNPKYAEMAKRRLEGSHDN